MGKGEILFTCANCYNASVYARRAERKLQLSEHWQGYSREQREAMREVGAVPGQRVTCFLPSMLGGYFGGITLAGRIVLNRNGVAIVKLDRPYNGAHSAAWHKGWKEVQS